MDKLTKFLKAIFYAIFALIFVYVSAKLFLDFKNPFQSEGEEGVEDMSKTLNLVFPNELTDFEPTRIDPITRERLINIYEPLVKTDENFLIQPGLALNWGLVDDKTWQFTLRQNVKFHDGSAFDAKDAKASIERARNFESSELKEVLASISQVKVMDDYLLEITTKTPDPRLLQKLALVLMIPEEFKEPAIPVGTGTYKFLEFKAGEETAFERFDDYWGEKALYEKVTLYVRTDKVERVKMLLNGNAEFLAYVPYDAAKVLEDKGFEVSATPSLELQFLLFNFKSKPLAQLKARQAISLTIDQNYLVEKVGGFAKKANQFVSLGIFGFDPKIAEHEYDLEKAKTLLKEAGLVDVLLQVHLSEGLTLLGEHIRTQLAAIGVDAVISYMPLDKLMESIELGSADIYFLAFKSDMGDSQNFFEEVLATGANFNIGNYSNENMDYLIASSKEEMDEKIRKKNLQKAMDLAVTKDVVGVPLFEYETLYGFSAGLKFNPRLDGLIYFDDLTEK